MTRLDRINSFIRTLTGRMVLGELVIHCTLIPTLFFGINFIVKEGYQSRFIEQANSESELLATIIAHDANHQHIGNLLNDAVKSNQVLTASLFFESGKTISAQSSIDHLPPFIEDQHFSQHSDDIFHLITPVVIPGQNSVATLHTRFDEKPVAALIQRTYQVSILLACCYILVTLILSGLLGQQLTRPIRKLRDDARAIASGNIDKPLNVVSSISEVASLTENLETMKEALITAFTPRI